MKEKRFYMSPETEVTELKLEGIIAASAPDYQEEDLFEFPIF